MKSERNTPPEENRVEPKIFNYIGLTSSEKTTKLRRNIHERTPLQERVFIRVSVHIGLVND